MKYYLFFFIAIYSHWALGQTKIPYPKPLVIDLSNPKINLPKGLDKEAKKEWKKTKRLERLNFKNTNKLYKAKLDSLASGLIPSSNRTEMLNTHQISNSLVYKDYILRTTDSLKESSASFKRLQIRNLRSKYNIDYPHSELFDIPVVDSVSRDSSRIGFSEKRYLTETDSSYSKKLFNSTTSQDILQEEAFDFQQHDTQTDSTTHREYMKEVDILEDSLASIDYSTMASSLVKGKLENQITSMFPAEVFTDGSQGLSEEQWQNSFQEMMGSDQYQELMSSMPGKKQDFEQAISQQTSKIESFTKKENFFTGHEEELLNAQAQLVVIKKKRSFLEAIKSLVNQDMESLDSQSPLQRFTLSGHVQVDGTKPLLIDYAPSIAYQLTGKLFLGVGVSGRIQIGDDPTEDSDFKTARVFSEYKILRGTFLRVEWERAGFKQDGLQIMNMERVWSNRWFIGLGKDFQLSKNIKGNLLLLYNLNADKSIPNNQRLQVRYGFKL